MIYSPASIPLLHGEVGLLDELLLVGAPLLVAIIILSIARQRARKNVRPRERASHDSSNDPSNSPHDSTKT